MERAASILSSVLGRSKGPSEPSAKVASIIIYPIKSCRGVSVPKAPITATGFRWDRNWLVVNSKGRAYTQRVEPKLAFVETELPSDAFNEDWQPNESSYLVLKAPGMDILKVPLNRECTSIDGISVWEWSGTAFDEGTEASEWFSEYLGKPSRLVRFNTGSEVRAPDPNYAQGYKIVFTDEYPFLMISQGSMDMLNNLLKEPVSVNRFRPNIVIDGCQPFSEDLWKVIKMNELTFHGVKLCPRCKVPNIDQQNGISGAEPTETLLKFRSDRALNLEKKKGKVYFGQYLVCEESVSACAKTKTVEVGDPIYVLEAVPSSADAPV